MNSGGEEGGRGSLTFSVVGYRRFGSPDTLVVAAREQALCTLIENASATQGVADSPAHIAHGDVVHGADGACE